MTGAGRGGGSQLVVAEPRRRRRRLALAAAGLLAAMGMAGAAVVAAPLVLSAGGMAEPADVLVALGGDPHERVMQASRLHRAGVAPWVIVTGRVDCDPMTEVLAAQGVPRGAVVKECAATSTLQNAAFTVRLMQARGWRSAVIVTSWYHTRRTLRCFKRTAPAMSFAAVDATPAPAPGDRSLFGREALRLVMLEYVKMAWYELPFGRHCRPV